MNTSNILPKTTLKDCSISKIRANTYAYRVDNSIYLNITNRCTNDCVFCLRNNSSDAYGSDPLWLEKEPSAFEVIDAINSIYFPECESFVFCGYGEPTCRLDCLLQVASLLKNKYTLPIRLNTNGQSELINGCDSTKRLFGIIDKVSISLNAPNAKCYDSICKSVFGETAFNAIISFGKNCVGNIPDVVFSIVEETISPDDIAKCKEIVEEIGAKIRIRKFIVENDKNPEVK